MPKTFEVAQLKNRKAKLTGKAIDDGVSWLFVGICVCAAILLDKAAGSNKWHAAIAWTGIAFSSVVIVLRSQWRSTLFWAKWSILLVCHVGIMWLLFAHLLSKIKVGMLYVMPVAFVETFVLLGLISLKWFNEQRS